MCERVMNKFFKYIVLGFMLFKKISKTSSSGYIFSFRLVEAAALQRMLQLLTEQYIIAHMLIYCQAQLIAI